MELCKYDIDNYDHNCSKLALPCAYLGNMEDCPIIRKERSEEATHRTRRG